MVPQSHKRQKANCFNAPYAWKSTKASGGEQTGVYGHGG